MNYIQYTTTSNAFCSVDLNVEGQHHNVDKALMPSLHDLEHLIYGKGFSRKHEEDIFNTTKDLFSTYNLGVYDGNVEPLFNALGINYRAYTNWLKAPYFPATFGYNADSKTVVLINVNAQTFSHKNNVTLTNPTTFSYSRQDLLAECVKHDLYLHDLLDDLYYGYDQLNGLVVAAGYYDDHLEHDVNYCIIPPTQFGLTFRDVDLIKVF
jgi:hypothetical protein